jgi:hypothetical protein
MSVQDRTQESRVRRLARRCGYRVLKARGRLHFNNHGAYQLVDGYNSVVMGADYHASLAAIEAYLKDKPRVNLPRWNR